MSPRVHLSCTLPMPSPTRSGSASQHAKLGTGAVKHTAAESSESRGSLTTCMSWKSGCRTRSCREQGRGQAPKSGVSPERPPSQRCPAHVRDADWSPAEGLPPVATAWQACPTSSLVNSAASRMSQRHAPPLLCSLQDVSRHVSPLPCSTHTVLWCDRFAFWSSTQAGAQPPERQAAWKAQ